MKQKILVVLAVVAVLLGATWLMLPWFFAQRARLNNRLPEAAWRALLNDPKLVLMSIDPDRRNEGEPNAVLFQRYRVLGQTIVTDPAQRAKLAETLQHGLGQWSGYVVTSCFSPRHAIRATSGSETFDFLVCFECGWLYYYPPGDKKQNLKIRTKAGPFDEILVSANVPMPKPPAGR